MRAGGGHAKGAQFERWVCKALSGWVSHGKLTDLFWRTAMSGGRATLARRKGVRVRQSGDICSVSSEGHSFTSEWYVECKHYRNINLSGWALLNRGPLRGWWKTAVKNARQEGLKPMLIVKQNGWPVLVFTGEGRLMWHTRPLMRIKSRGVDVSLFSDMVSERYTPWKH